MYFLQQIRIQFILTATLEVGGPDGAVEQSREIEAASREEQGPRGPDDVIRMAQQAEEAGERAGALANEGRRALELGDNPTVLSYGSEVEGESLSSDGFDLSGAELSQGSPAPLGNRPRNNDEYDMGERVSSPEEITLLRRLEEGEIGFDDPEVAALAEELGMEELLRTAGIDGIERGEVAEGIEESTPEMLEGSRDEIQGELDIISTQIASLPEDSPERQNLEQRSSFLSGFIQTIEDALNGQTPGSGGFSGVDVVGDRNVMSRGMAHRGIHEDSGRADKFLMGMARSARETPWCAGFVSYVCQEAGYDITPTLSSKAFIGETGKGHVAFYAGNGQMLGGNQSDRVSVAPIRKEIQGWTMPEDLEAGRPPNRGGTPPVGAIIVFNRGGSDRNMA